MRAAVVILVVGLLVCMCYADLTDKPAIKMKYLVCILPSYLLGPTMATVYL